MDVAEIHIPTTSPTTAHSDNHQRLFASLRSLATPQRVDRGEVLWHQFDESEELAFVISGELEVVVSGHVIGIVRADEVLGEASMFGPLVTRTATIRASEDSVVELLSREQVQAMRDDAPDLYDSLLEHALVTLANRVRTAGEQLLRLGESSLERPAAEPGGTLHEASRFLGGHANQVALRSLRMFRDAEQSMVEELAQHFVSRVYEGGEVILKEGDASRSIFLIANGEVDLVCNIGSSGAMPVQRIERGCLFGQLSAVLGKPRSGTVIADGPCWLLELPYEVHAALDGELGRVWREALLCAIRREIEHSDRQRVLLKSRREELLRDTRGRSNGVEIPSFLTVSQRDAVRAQVDAIFSALAPHRRLLPESGDCAHTPCGECFGLHRDRVERRVAAHAPIHMILPAYPAKSPNAQTKVVGRLPDMAEEQSLLYLQRVCEQIAAVYEPGARVTICSDGRVFSDLVLVGDEDITDYGVEIDAMIERLDLNSIDVFAIEDLFEEASFEGMRDHLAVHYGDRIDALRERAKLHPHHRSMYNGIHRFLFEDSLTVESGKSRTKIRKECSERAYGVIQRSNAFSRLIAECFPDALRLSIHPQPAHAAKIGILLGTASDAWITPWHGVAVLDSVGYHLMKREAAETMGATLIHRFGRPSHYEVSHVM